MIPVNFPVEEGVYHVLTAIGVPNIHFFLAAIPVQLILFFFYLSRRQLPLRESRSFLVLMGWNMVIFLTDLLLVYTDSMVRKEELPFLTLFFFCSVLLENYFLFYYFCDALQADAQAQGTQLHTFAADLGDPALISAWLQAAAKIARQ